jgi:pilus assembly protein CpaF
MESGENRSSADSTYGSGIKLRLDKKYEQLRENVHKEIVSEYNARFINNELSDDSTSDILALIHQSLDHQEQRLTKAEEAKLAQEILDDVLGLGPLEPMLRDESISEIMVNSASQIYIERFGKLELTNSAFRDDAHVLQVINRIVSSVGADVMNQTPW